MPAVLRQDALEAAEILIPRLNQHSPQPEQGTSEVQKAGEAGVAAIIASGNASEVLALVETAFDAIALPAEYAVRFGGHLAVALGWNDCRYAQSREQGT